MKKAFNLLFLIGCACISNLPVLLLLSNDISKTVPSQENRAVILIATITLSFIISINIQKVYNKMKLK